MALPPKVNLGTAPNNGTGDVLRIAFSKLNVRDEYLEGLIESIKTTQVVSSLPPEPQTQVLYVNVTDKTLQVWDGNEWVEIGSGEVTYQVVVDALGYVPEPKLENPVSDGMVLSSDTEGNRTWVAQETSEGGVSQQYVDDADAATLASANSFTNGALEGKEDTANKAEDFTVISHMRYPSIQAVVSYLNSQGFITNYTVTEADVLNALDYTPENTDNKATNLSTSNHTLYPTVKAVLDYLQGQGYITSYTVTEQDVISAIGFNPANDAEVVKTVNNQEPDENGNVTVEAGSEYDDTAITQRVSDAEDDIESLEQNKANDSEVVKSVKTSDGEELKDENGNVVLPEFSQNDVVLWGIDEWTVQTDPPTGLSLLDPTTGFDGWTIDRNSTATYIDANGYRQTAQPNEARIDHSTGDPKILVEPEAANEILDSENLNYGWTHYQNDLEKLPDGSIEFTRTNEAWPSWSRQNTEATGLKTVSLKAKYIDVRYLVFIQVTSGNSDLSIDLTNGTVAYNRDNIPVTVNMADDGWVYIEFPRMPELRESTSHYPYLQLNAVADGFTNSNAGNLGSCLIKELQLETGGKATSYIPTTGTIATRLADEITTTPPEGTTEIIEVVDGVENIITDIPATYQLPVGNIDKIEFR